MILLFADDVVLLASLVDDIQNSLERFTAESEVAGMKINTSKLEVKVLSQKTVGCLLWGRRLSKYLGVLFTSSRKMQQVVRGVSGNAGGVLDHCSKADEIWLL